MTHTSTEQPEALRLAHTLSGGKLIDDSTEWADTLHAAAAKLCHQHARIEELEAKLATPAHEDARDAARYRWLREGNDAKHGAAWHVAVNLYGCEWDAAIDAAMAAQARKEKGVEQ